MRYAMIFPRRFSETTNDHNARWRIIETNAGGLKCFQTRQLPGRRVCFAGCRFPNSIRTPLDAVDDRGEQGRVAGQLSCWTPEFYEVTYNCYCIVSVVSLFFWKVFECSNMFKNRQLFKRFWCAIVDSMNDESVFGFLIAPL